MYKDHAVRKCPTVHASRPPHICWRLSVSQQLGRAGTGLVQCAGQNTASNTVCCPSEGRFGTAAFGALHQARHHCISALHQTRSASVLPACATGSAHCNPQGQPTSCPQVQLPQHSAPHDSRVRDRRKKSRIQTPHTEHGTPYNQGSCVR